MSWFVIFLGVVLTGAGGAALMASIDLQTTEVGLVYATCGAVATTGGIIVIAIALLMRKVDAVRRALAHGSERALDAAPPSRIEPPLVGVEAAALRETSDALRAAPPIEPPATPSLGAATEQEATVDEAGELPSQHALGQADKDPPAPPTLVGRYTAGGSNYSIYSDGSIEAETDQGAFKFDSMNDFKAYIAAKRG